MGWIIGAAFSFFYTVAIFIQIMKEPNLENLCFTIGAFIICTLCIWKAIKRIGEKKGKYKKPEEKKSPEKENGQSEKDKVYKPVLYLEGLSFPSRCKGEIRLKEKQLTMEFDGNEVSLDISRIVALGNTCDVKVKTYEKPQSFVQGTPGTDAHDMEDSALTSIAERKEKTKVSSYAYIVYTTQKGGASRLVFKDTADTMGYICEKLVLDLKERLPDISVVDIEEKRKVEL